MRRRPGAAVDGIAVAAGFIGVPVAARAAVRWLFSTGKVEQVAQEVAAGVGCRRRLQRPR